MSEINRSRNSQGHRSTSGRNTSGNVRGTGSKSRSTASGGARSSKASSDRILAVQNARNLDQRRGTSSRQTQTGARRRKKGRRKGPDVAKILLIVIGIVIFLLCVAVGFRSCAKEDNEASDASQDSQVSTEPETELEAEITINGINIQGMTKSEAREAILKDMKWAMKVSFNGETKDVLNVMNANLEKVLTEAFDMPHETAAPQTTAEEESLEGGTSTQAVIAYTIPLDGLEEAVRTQVDSLAEGWDTEPKNGSISSYDKSTGEFVFTGAKNGTVIERDQLVTDLMARITAGDYDATVTAASREVEPEITEAEAKANFKRLGTFTTTTTANKARNENIRIACEALNGKIIQPGEEFSFNLTTGNRTTDKGYQAAGAYQNGVLVEEPGGGVCQVSSTLYNAVVFSGLKTTERHAHSYEPSYVTPGEDAMVSYDGYSGPDMKFVNNSKTAVGIKTSFSNQKLTISIYGNPILEEGVTLSMHSEKIKEIDPPAPLYEEDGTLQPGEEKIVVKPVPGSRWSTNLITKKNGEVVSDVPLHNSTYNGKAGTIKRNSSGTVAAGSESSSASDSSSEGLTSTADPSAPSSSGQASESSSSSSSGGGVTGTSASSDGGAGNAGNSGTSSSGGNNSGAQNLGPGDTILPSENNNDDPGSGGPGMQPTTAPQPQTIPQTMPQTEPETQPPVNMGIITPIN